MLLVPLGEKAAKIFLGRGGGRRKIKLLQRSVPLRQRGITPYLKGGEMHLWKVVQKEKRGRKEKNKHPRQYIFGFKTVTAVCAVFPKDKKVFIDTK